VRIYSVQRRSFTPSPLDERVEKTQKIIEQKIKRTDFAVVAKTLGPCVCVAFHYSGEKSYLHKDCSRPKTKCVSMYAGRDQKFIGTHRVKVVQIKPSSRMPCVCEFFRSDCV
jgi:hypothetical protein